MAEPGEELLEGDLGDTDYNELDADEEEALLADDSGYTSYNLPTVSSHRDVYISTSPDAKPSRKLKVEDVEDVAEGDEILDNEEDVLELGVEGNWNLDDDSESQEQNRSSEGKPSLFQLWIKQERVDPSQFDRRNESDEDEEKHESGNSRKSFITSSADISQSHLHDDDDEDYHERRDRFTSERSMPGAVSLKSPDSKWGAIPDSLDSVITPSAPKVTVHKSNRGGSTAGRGGGVVPARRGGGLAGRLGVRPPANQAPHHKVLINPHFKGTTPAAPPPQHQFPQTNPGTDYRAAQPVHQHFDQPGHQYQTQQDYQQYQSPNISQYPPQSQPQYQEPSYPHNTPHVVTGQNQQYQNEWQNPAVSTQQQYDQSNYSGYYGESQAPPQPAWNSPAQPVYQDYNQPHHPQQQPPHQPPHHQPPPPHPHPHPAMRPPVAPSVQHIVSQQQPPPPGLEAEFQPRKPGPFLHQVGPPRTFFPPQHHQPPFRPPGGPMPPVPHQHPLRMPPPSPQNQSPQRFSPRFKRGGFQRGGFPPQFRHPGGPRMMPPGPPPNAMFNPRLPNYQKQKIKRPHPEPKKPHQPPFKQMRLNQNGPDPNKAGKPTVQRNLLEVQTVDNVPDTTTCSDHAIEEEFDEDDDDETREYKRKIAEQKRLRQKLLQEKEERRKLAAAAKQKELEQRKVVNQNIQNTQQMSIPQNPVYIKSSQQPSFEANDGSSRVSVHQRIGMKPSPVKQFNRNATQVTFFNEQQPTAFKVVQVRTKDGEFRIKKVPLNSAGEMMLQRSAPHTAAPPHMVPHHQLTEPQHLMQPIPPQHIPPAPAPQHQPIYHPPQAAHLPPPHPPPPPQPEQYYAPQTNAAPHHIQPQQSYYQQPMPQHHLPQQAIPQQPISQQQPSPQQPPQMMPSQNTVPVVNSKRIVVGRSQLQTKFKANRLKAKQVFKKHENVNSNSSVLTIVPVNKNMTLGQRFAMQNKQVKKEQNQPKPQPQPQKVPVQAKPVTKPNRTVINSVLNAGAPTIRIPLPPGPVTSKVVVDNLTAGTSRQQLVSMAEQVGEVKILTLDTSQKRASITFNNTKAATAFYQKFQRKMVNLSMINVTFVPE